ncbi:MAG: LysR family transcriptional regulator [Xanthobacteraceae bacterium]
MSRLSLDRLRTFIRVIELGSFSAAAIRLELSQPAISLQVRELEKQAGVRLIERVARRAAPTAAGEELLGYARRIDAMASEALDAMQRHAQGTIGRIRLGTGDTACIYFLPPVLRGLRQQFPSLDIVVSTGNSPDILKSIEENTIDVGLVTLPAPGRVFDIQPVLDDDFVAITSRSTAPLPERVTAGDLSKLAVVLYEPGANTRQLIDQWAIRAGVSLKPAMELGSVEAIKEVVGAGLGWGVVPAMALPGPCALGHMDIRPLHPRLYRKLAIVMRRDKPLQRGLREVINAIKASAKTFRATSATAERRKSRHE